MTIRSCQQLTSIGLATCGKGGTRLAARLGIHTSRQTILRRIMALPDPPLGSILSLGRDDFAFRRGCQFGTILVNLESHRVVDLLPDRKADTSAAWMRQQLDLMVVSRDRGGEYASAATQGAPQALQCADRFHLLRNLGEALEGLLAHHLATERKLGMSQAAIARQVGIGASTVQSWLAASRFPERKPREQASHLDRYLPYLFGRWQDGCHNMACLFRELGEQGYKGSYESVRDNLVRLLPTGRKNAADSSSKAPALPTSRQAAFLFLHRPEKLRVEEQERRGRAPSDPSGGRSGL
jgi:transcriptional regulator with XRE-family HTH domain